MRLISSKVWLRMCYFVNIESRNNQAPWKHSPVICPTILNRNTNTHNLASTQINLLSREKDDGSVSLSLWLTVRTTKMITCLSHCVIIVFLPTSYQLCSLWNQGTHPSHLTLQILWKFILNKWRMKWMNRSNISRLLKYSALVFNVVSFSYHTKC